MLISEDSLLVFRCSMYAGFCSIFVLSVSILSIFSLCAKKSQPAVSKTQSIKATANAGAALQNCSKDNITNNNNNNNNNEGGGGQSKSQKGCVPNSPATTPINGETTPGAPTPPAPPTPTEPQKSGSKGGGAGNNGGGGKDKSMTADKPTKDEDKNATKDTNDTKDKEDSFECHKPVVRDAKRADEIKKLGPVDQKRKDYKTLRYDVPSSDFDKSLGLPNLEEKEKEKQETAK